jgi:hypothetical protein
MKRFTETQKWEDPWFRKLRPEMKLLWQWLCDKCDNAGVIDPDMDLASFQIGYQYPSDTLSEFGERLAILESGKVWIPSFIPFQCGKLSDDCAAHKPIFQSLEKHGLDRVSIGYQYPLRKGIGKGIGKGQGIREDAREENPPSKARGTRDEFVTYAQEIGLPKTDGEFLHDHFLESGWKRGKEPIKDWKAAMRKWQSAKWLPSQKQQPNSKPPKQQTFAGTYEDIPL